MIPKYTVDSKAGQKSCFLIKGWRYKDDESGFEEILKNEMPRWYNNSRQEKRRKHRYTKPHGVNQKS